jgi:hypothetical protein
MEVGIIAFEGGSQVTLVKASDHGPRMAPNSKNIETISTLEDLQPPVAPDLWQ